MANPNYRLTPRRRAALHRAQMISAQRRRRARFGNALRTAGTVGAAVGTSVLVYHLTEYGKHPDKAVRHGKVAYGFAKRKLGHSTVVPSPKLAATTRRNLRPIRGYYGGKSMHHAVAGRQIRSK